MGRLKKEDREIYNKQVEEGFLTCKTCKEIRELKYFGRQKYRQPNGISTFVYKVSKCKICKSPKGENMKPHSYVEKGEIKKPKLLKAKMNAILSPECRKFIKRLIMMRGYIDSVEAFQLVDHHLNTFGYNERLITDTEQELIIMFQELLEIYYKYKHS